MTNIQFDTSLGTIAGELSAAPNPYAEIALDPAELSEHIADHIRANLAGNWRALLVYGGPGMGKSRIIESVTARLGGVFYDKIRPTMLTATDFAFPDVQSASVDWKPSAVFPFDPPKLPDGTDAPFGVICMDEFADCQPDVQTALYQFLESGSIAGRQIDRKWVLIGSTNYADGGSLARRLPQTIKSRIDHVHMMPSFEAWKEHALESGVELSIVAFLMRYPELLYVYNPKDKNSDAFPCPRNWSDSVSPWLQTNPSPKLRRRILQGKVGAFAGLAFEAFLKIRDALPPLVEIENDPQGARIPADNSVSWAMLSYLLQHATPRNWGRIAQYMSRLPAEFQAFAVVYFERSGSELATHPATIAMREQVMPKAA